MDMRIKIDDFDAKMRKILDDYTLDVAEKTRTAVLKDAKVARQETQAQSPKLTGAYQAGWSVKEDKSSRLRTGAIVHNRTRYQLTHLLEKGHAKRGGGRVEGIPHIAPAEENAIRNLEEALKKIAAEG